MTRRILGSFLAVLAAVIAALVVPLGLSVTAQQEHDFRADAGSVAHAISAVAEEHLDDRVPLDGLNTVVARFAADGDSVIVLDNAGQPVAQAGQPIPSAAIAAAHAGLPMPRLRTAIAVSDPVGDADRTLGVTVLLRGTAPLEHRRMVLWLTLAAAAGATLLLGATVGWSLGRWINRPLASLARAAHGVGTGEPGARANDRIGPHQIREVAGAFNDMADRVCALLEAQRGMTADVSHQLRTPLAALRLRLELLGQEVEGERADEVGAMIDETNRLARLVDGLLAVARAEATPSMPTEIDLGALASDRLEAWRPVAGDRGIALTLDARTTRAVATPGHVEQILDNLLDNAIDAVPDRGRVSVCVRQNGATASLVVSDNGPGMSPERRAHALDRFVTARAGRGGTGLGLAVVGRLVTADRGSAELRETPGGGLTVEIALPAPGVSRPRGVSAPQ